MHFTKEEFQEVKLKAENDYKLVGEVHCPFLNEKIIFNSKGLEHLEYKMWNFPRTVQDQFVRLKLLHIAPEILKKSHTLQGISEGNRMERIKLSGRWEQRMLYVIYYEFISIVHSWRIKILVKRINNGQPFFWSIIPFGKLTEHRRKLFTVNPEEA